MSVFCFWIFLKSVGRSLLGVDVGAEGLLESVHASMACLWVVGVVGFVGDFGGSDGVSVFVGFKEFWSFKECWSVLVLIGAWHGEVALVAADSASNRMGYRPKAQGTFCPPCGRGSEKRF